MRSRSAVILRLSCLPDKGSKASLAVPFRIVIFTTENNHKTRKAAASLYAKQLLFSLFTIHNLREKLQDRGEPLVGVVLAGQAEDPQRQIQTKVCHDSLSLLSLMFLRLHLKIITMFISCQRVYQLLTHSG